MALKTILGMALVLAGAVLAIFFWDLQFGWFQGGPIGLLVGGLGAIDLLGARRRTAGGRPKGLLQELRDDLMGPPREVSKRDDDDNSRS